jgi:K+-sensing histidine kinase KdpD
MSLTALLMTAAVFTQSGQSVSVICSDEADTVTLILESTGRELDEKTIDGFFDLSSSVRSSTRAEILGLKPVVAERVISLYGGTVELRNQQDKGIAINITMKKSTSKGVA